MTITLKQVFYASLIATASFASVAHGIEATAGGVVDISSKTVEATVDVRGNVENQEDGFEYGIDSGNGTSVTESVRVSINVSPEVLVVLEDKNDEVEEEDNEVDDEELDGEEFDVDEEFDGEEFEGEEFDGEEFDDEEFDDEEEFDDDEYDYDEYEEEEIVIDEEMEGPGAKFGVLQIISREDINEEDTQLFNETATLEVLEETDEYMTMIRADPSFDVVRKTCYNYDSLCTAWAAHGECENNSEYMEEACAPACQSCDQLHFSTRCPVDDELLESSVWKAGDLNKMFEAIVSSSLKGQIHILSRPSENREEGGPWIIAIDDFFTVEDAQHIIEMGEEMGFQRNLISGGEDEISGEPRGNVESEHITSSSTWCIDECDEDETVETIYDKLEELTQIPFENTEQMQIVKYEEGQFYASHADFIEYERDQMIGARILTALLYFNDVEEGGQTYFPEIDLKVKPKAGRVLLFANVLNEDPDERDERVDHEALPAMQQKYAANIWMHSRDVSEATALGCYGM